MSNMTIKLWYEWNRLLCISHIPSVTKDENKNRGVMKGELTADEKCAEILLVGVIGVSILMSKWKKHNINIPFQSSQNEY